MKIDGSSNRGSLHLTVKPGDPDGNMSFRSISSEEVIWRQELSYTHGFNITKAEYFHETAVKFQDTSGKYIAYFFMDDDKFVIELLDLLKFIIIRSRLLAYKFNTQIWSSYEAELSGKQRDIKTINELFPLISPTSNIFHFGYESQHSGK